MALYGRVTASGVEVPIAALQKRVGDDAIAKFFLKAQVKEKIAANSPNKCRPPKVLKAFRRAGGMAVMSRYVAALLARAKLPDGTPYIDGVTAPAPPSTREVTAAMAPLYPYQRAVVDWLLGDEVPRLGAEGTRPGPLSERALAEGGGHAYIEIDTGLGKTRMAIATGVRLRTPTLFVVPTKSIASGILSEAKKFGGLRAALYTTKSPATARTHDLVVIIINTFRNKGPDFLAGYGLLVLDEASEYYSPKNGHACRLAQAVPRVLAMSATPRAREDKLDQWVALMIGCPLPLIGQAFIGVPEARFEGRVRAVRYVGHPDHARTEVSTAGTVSAPLTIAAICGDPHRVEMIARRAVELFYAHETGELELVGGVDPPSGGAAPRHTVMVLAELRDYLPKILAAVRRILAESAEGAGDTEGAENTAVVCPEMGTSAPGDTPYMTMLRGGVSDTAVPEAASSGPAIIVGTYGFMRRGVSITHASALILATARSSGGQQILGRILRRGSDQRIVRVVEDIIDDCTALRKQFAKRKVVYKAKGWPIETVAASWEDYELPPPPLAPYTPDWDLVAEALDDVFGLSGPEIPEQSLDELMAVIEG